jgi:NAD+ synthase (glutamine-hydrolysing)
MKIALAQINSVLGDFSANRLKILSFVRDALAQGCDLVVFPELSLFGYLPNDLLERQSIVDEQLTELSRLEKEMPEGISALVGCVTYALAKSDRKKNRPQDSLSKKILFNSAALIEKGSKSRFFHKERLPTYDVFDEARHLVPGSLAKGRIKFRTKYGAYSIQISICEDIWGWGWGDPANPMKKIPRTGHDLVINMSASPFTKTKRKNRLAVVKKTAEHFRAPVVYVNMVGGQDEIVFDGRSLVVDKKGRAIAELAAFREDLQILDLDAMKVVKTVSKKSGRYNRGSARASEVEIIRQGLVTGVRDFAIKTGLQRCHFGLSGGIDSAVVACIAVEALGVENVTAVTLPGPFNDPKSREWAEALAEKLSIRCLNMSIEKPYEALLNSFETSIPNGAFNLVNENLQARVRGVLLMAISNKESSLLLSTGNKSEYACGYTTLYGDQCGGLAPLGDLLKREVYALARLYNLDSEIIPTEIIDRAPSAELRPNQKDQDSLPPYDELDAAVERIIEQRLPARTKTEQFVLQASLKSEFKRWQAPPILKISDHAFGRGRRFPIAHRACK